MGMGAVIHSEDGDFQTPAHKPKILEQEVQLEGMEHPVQVRIVSIETLDDTQWSETLAKSRETVKNIAKDFDLSAGQYRIIFSIRAQ